jgi:hypothetical protein
MPKKFYIEDGEAIPAIIFVETPPQGYTEITDSNQVLELTLSREMNQRRLRKEYGLLLYEIISSQLRLLRVSIDPSLLYHSQTRATLYLNLEDLKNSVSSGNFIDAYEDLNSITPQSELTENQIIVYRNLLSTYMVSSNDYTDAFGNNVNGGNYDELSGKDIDSQGFINE